MLAAVQNAGSHKIAGPRLSGPPSMWRLLRAVIFISWSGLQAESITEEQSAGDKHCQFAVAHNDFLR